MTLSRTLPFLLLLAAIPPSPAAAQFGGTPGTPSGPAPPPACQQLLSLRDETQKHAQALQAAGQKKVSPEKLCKLFKVYLAAESQIVKGLEESYATCGLPASVPEQVKANHAKASEMGKNICDVAARPIPSRQYSPDICTEKDRRLGIPASIEPCIMVLLSPDFQGCYSQPPVRPGDRPGLA
jgi:hypothetical protein